MLVRSGTQNYAGAGGMHRLQKLGKEKMNVLTELTMRSAVPREIIALVLQSRGTRETTLDAK
jgi:hypothetical protein